METCSSSSENGTHVATVCEYQACQFWSILTLLTINKMHQLIDKEGLQDDVQCISTIYDSIYYLVKDDPKTIKWVNDNLSTIMVKDWMVDQTIANEATAEIGLNWADMIQLDNHASLDTTKKILDIVKNNLISTTSVKDEHFITVYKAEDETVTSQPLTSIAQVKQWQQEAEDYFKEHS